MALGASLQDMTPSLIDEVERMSSDGVLVSMEARLMDGSPAAVFAGPGFKERAALLCRILTSGNHVAIGLLLGYGKENVDFFMRRNEPDKRARASQWAEAGFLIGKRDIAGYFKPDEMLYVNDTEDLK